MEKKNRVAANPYCERAKLEPKKLLRLAASQPIDGRWLERVLEVNPSATAANQRCILEQHRALPYMRKC